MESKRMTSTRSMITKSNRFKFIAGGILLVGAVIILMISATQDTAEFFMTVQEVKDSPAAIVGQNLRISGAVVGESIRYDANSGILHFTIAHIPGDDDEINRLGGLETVLHQAVASPDNPHLGVIYQGPKPDMLRDEAQAIITGTLNQEGIFIAEELLLKCPSKYEELVPDQVEK